jgi:hypothetical protein
VKISENKSLLTVEQQITQKTVELHYEAADAATGLNAAFATNSLCDTSLSTSLYTVHKSFLELRQ